MTEKLREKIQHLWCQHCKALQKSNETVVECWYNPLDADGAFAFCAGNEDAIDQIFKSLKESGLVQLDENQEFPEIELPKTKYHLSVIIRYYLREQGFKRVKEIK